MNGYGIDSMVQSRADAYRANPDGLAKSYANNQQLIDLLALQKLKSEKEAAARQLTLSAQQAPGTVAQQREQELLGLTRNEIAQQAGAIGEQQEQQMLQQAGLAGLPAQNLESMQGYAEGGVVGYAEGGSPASQGMSDEEIAAFLEQPRSDLGEFSIEALNWVKENPVDAASLGLMLVPGAGLVGAGVKIFGVVLKSKTAGSALSSASRFASKLVTKPNPAVLRGQGFTMRDPGAPLRVFDPNRAALTGAAGLQGLDYLFGGESEGTQTEMPAETALSAPGEPSAPAPAPRTNTQDMQDVGGLSSLIPRTAALTTAAPVAGSATPRERSALEQALEDAQLTALQTSGGDARNAGQQTAEDFFSPQTEARNARYAEIQRKLQEIDAREADPKARAKEAMREWMRGAANTSGGLSRLLQGGSNQSRAYIDEQEAADKSRMMEMFGLEKDLGAEELAMARDIFGAGETAEDRGNAARNTAMQTVTQLIEGTLNREEEAKFNAERNKLQMRQVEAEEARNALEQGRITNAEFQTRVVALGRQYDMMLSGLEAQLSSSLPGTPEAVAINTAITELSADYSRAMQEFGGGTMPAMGGTGASVSPEIQALLDKYSQ